MVYMSKRQQPHRHENVSPKPPIGLQITTRNLLHKDRFIPSGQVYSIGINVFYQDKCIPSGQLYSNSTNIHVFHVDKFAPSRQIYSMWIDLFHQDKAILWDKFVPSGCLVQRTPKDFQKFNGHRGYTAILYVNVKINQYTKCSF